MTTWHIDTVQTTEYLRAIVQIDSVNPDLAPGGVGEGEMARWLVGVCENLGLEVQTQQTAPGRPNVLARWRGSGNGKSLLLTGHTDVVSVENMLGDPFDARIEAGRLYGRGAIDMKGGLAAILGAVATLRTGGFQPKGDLWLGFVTDEEYASIGMDALVKVVHPDAAILTEPTDLRVTVAHKGFVWATITTRGEAAHGSLYNVGVDAVAHMGRVLRELERFDQEVFPQREHPLLGRPSVHASLIHGGLGLSTYPDTCTLQLEHRLLPDETPQQMAALWDMAFARLRVDDARFDASFKLDFSRPGYEIDQRAPIVTTLDSAFQQVIGQPPEYWGMSAWLDAAILGQAGIPTVIFGPTGEGAHAAVEYVTLESVHQCAAVLAEAAALWCNN